MSPGPPPLRFCVLGPLQAWRDGVALALGSPQQQALLAALVLREGAQAGTDELVDGLWGDDPPPAARGTVRTYLSRLRGVLGPRDADGPLVGVGGGYLLRRADYSLDLWDFRDAVEEAAAGGDRAAAAGRLHDALGLWRGTPLGGLPGPYAEAQRRRLTQLRTTAAEDRLAADLELGRYARVLDDLPVLVAQEPLRERLRELEIRALWGLGRQSDALDAYARARRVLGDELGIDPGPELRRLQARILAGEAAPARTPAPAPVAAAGPRPAQLPADVAGFAERDDELRALQAAVPGGGDAAAVVVVGGMAGVGKTGLAVHWAHRAAAAYPDGQLYANLRGYEASAPALDPAEAIEGFLGALGVPAADVPAGTDRQSALFRSLVAGRRLLVLLDDARDADQVRPLLPGSPGSLVLVTSRDPLEGLIATDGARFVSLDVLTPERSVAFLAGRLGAARVAAEPDAAARLARRSGGLPLALAIVAARAAVNPGFSLAELADDAAAAGGLDAFATLDPVTDLRAVFSASYAALGAEPAALFRRLGAHPGGDTGRAAAASTGAVTAGEARRSLRELAAAQLVREHRPGRFAMHDLVRAYALELCAREGEELAATRLRVLDHYARTAGGLVALLGPRRVMVDGPPPVPGVTPETFGDAPAATRWFLAEHHLLLPVLEEGYRAGLDRHVLALAWALQTPQHVRGHWHDWLRCQQVALRSATRLGDQEWIGMVHHNLSLGNHHLEATGEALSHARQAIATFERSGSAYRLANAYVNLAGIEQATGDRVAAAEHREVAIAGYRALGDADGEATVQNNTGWSLLEQPDGAAAAAAAFTRSRDLYLGAGNRWAAAVSTANLAAAHARLRDGAAAAGHYRDAVAVLAELGSVVEQAEALTELGAVHRDAGDDEAARAAWSEAARVLAAADDAHPGVTRLRARLAGHLAP